MTGFQHLQSKKILSCYNNLQIVNDNLREVGLLHEQIEDEETPGYQELEDEKLVDDFDSDNVEKGGEGSRGGKIIGHTKSGKPIYAHRDPNHHKGFEDFSSQDHEDAARHHENHAKFLDQKAKSRFNQGRHNESAELAGRAEHHKSISSSHKKRLQKLEKTSLEKGGVGSGRHKENNFNAVSEEIEGVPISKKIKDLVEYSFTTHPINSPNWNKIIQQEGLDAEEVEELKHYAKILHETKKRW